MLSLVGCTASTPLPTLAPTLEPPTATVARPTDTPASTNTAGPTATMAPRASAATPTTGAAVTEAATHTPEPTATEAATATPAIVYITYRDFEIIPAQTTIKVGATVVFLIQAGLFTFHQPYNFNPPNTFEAPAGLGNGKTYTFTFNEPGTVTLLCGYHAEMKATLIVEP